MYLCNIKSLLQVVNQVLHQVLHLDECQHYRDSISLLQGTVVVLASAISAPLTLIQQLPTTDIRVTFIA